MSSPSRWKFLDSWAKRTPYLLMGLGLSIVLLNLISPLLMSKKFDKSITVQQSAAQELGPIDIKPQLFGTTRIEVKALLRRQRWATYEVQLIDQKNQIVVAGVKNAWRESGTWYEDGESGTWDEADRDAGFDLQLRRAEPVKVAVSLVEVSDNRGRPVNEAVSFKVTAHQGTIETTPLWFSAIALFVLGWLRIGK